MTTLAPERPRGRARNRPAGDVLLLPYQERWVRDGSRLKLFEKSRQIGISWATSFAAVNRSAPSTAQWDQWVSSRDELQARLFLEDCKEFARILEIGAQDLGMSVLDEKGSTGLVLKMAASGRRIHSMSSNPDAQAGKRGSRILDEFALHPDPRKLWAIAYPGITWGGQLEVISTHRGSDNYFNVLVEEARHKGNRKGISLHRVTLQDALDEGFLAKLQAKLPDGDERLDMDEAEYFDFIRAGCSDEEQFQQEFMCVAADDESAFLPYELIDACAIRGNPGWLADLSEAEGPLYVGVDYGRDQDLTVIWVVERVGDVLHTRRLVALKKTSTVEQNEILADILREPKVKRCCIDRTGPGIGFTDYAQHEFGEYRVEAVTFTGPVKEELAFALRAAFEDRRIRIPADREITADLRKVRKTTTAAGNIRFEAERDSKGHADRFWALALAIHAAIPPKTTYGATLI